MKELFPVFVPLSEIDLQADTFNTNDRDGLITLTPKNGVLHGFCCKEHIEDYNVTFECCGTMEPKPWLARMWCRAYYWRGAKTIISKYPSDFGDMKDMPIDCIALAPMESGGYRVVGSEMTTIRFIDGRVTMMEDPDDIAGFEFANYEPMPFMNCDVEVEVEDCTEKELIERLDDLIRK